MEATRRQAVIRALTESASRRTTLGLLLGGSLTSLRNEVHAKGKKKKKCRRPAVRCGKKCCIKGECRFTVKKSRWLLQADCTITQAIEILNGVTLDGNGKTITISGPKSGYIAGGLNAGRGKANVVNLTIDGAGLTEPCATTVNDHDPSAIVYGQTSGRIENVTIRNINCTAAIAATTSDAAKEHSIEVVNAKITSSPPPDRAGVGINCGGVADGHLVMKVSESSFTSAALLFNTNVEATVDDCDLTATFVSGLNGINLTVLNSTITDATIGIIAEGSGTVLTATANTIVGPDDDQGLLIAGIEFRPGTSGSVTNNAISNYFVDGPSNGCGIRILTTPADVTEAGNTFPNPPGNEQNVCFSA